MKKKLIMRTAALFFAVVLVVVSLTVYSDTSYAEDVTETETTASADAEEKDTDTATADVGITGLTEAKIEKKSYHYVKAFEEDSKEEMIELCFVEGGDIPYIAVSDYMDLLSDAMKSRKMGEVSYKAQRVTENFYTVTRSDNESAMMIDTADDYIVFSDFNRFTQPEKVGALVSIMDIPEPEIPDLSDLSAKLEEAKTDEETAKISEEIKERLNGTPNQLFKSFENSINRAGDSPLLNLSEYMIEIVEADGECYMPFQTLNDLFIGPFFYLQFIFNGEKLYGLKYGEPILDEVYEAEPREMSEEFAAFNFNELCFFMDCMYGLKDEHNIKSFGHLIVANTEAYEGLTSKDPKKFDQTLRSVITQYMDDGHSGFLGSSWMAGKMTDFAMLQMLDYSGISLSQKEAVISKFSEARNAAYPDGVPMYEEVGDTAFITFDAFTHREDKDFTKYYDKNNLPDPKDFVIRNNESYEMPEDADASSEEVAVEELTETEEAAATNETETAEETTGGNEQTTETVAAEEDFVDTIWLLIYANERIHRENSPIKNVVMDLSLNSGGEEAAAVFAISWLTGNAKVALKDTFTGAETIMSIKADTNLNNDYADQSDSLGDDMNVYVLTSPVSFSCGNLIPAACKMMNGATIVGQQSGGGSCAVLPGTTASGAIFQMSGAKQLAVVKNGSYYNIDQGIAPDITLTKAESYYDREALAEYLKECK